LHAEVDDEFKRVFAPEEYARVHGQGSAENIEASARGLSFIQELKEGSIQVAGQGVGLPDVTATAIVNGTEKSLALASVPNSKELVKQKLISFSAVEPDK